MLHTAVDTSCLHDLPVSERRSAFRIWGRVFSFYLDHLPELLAILPLLFLPVFTDALHTILIRQHITRQSFRLADSVIRALETTLPLLRVKWVFWWRSLLWGMVPVIGLVKDA